MCCAIHIIVSFNFKWSCASFTLLSVSIFSSCERWMVNSVCTMCACAPIVLFNLILNVGFGIWSWTACGCDLSTIKWRHQYHVFHLFASNHLSTVASVYYLSTPPITCPPSPLYTTSPPLPPYTFWMESIEDILEDLIADEVEDADEFWGVHHGRLDSRGWDLQWNSGRGRVRRRNITCTSPSSTK